MFESGAIVLHLAERSQTLLPVEPRARARTTSWMFAALNSVEPRISMLLQIDLSAQKDEGIAKFRASVVEGVKGRLQTLAQRLEGRDYLEESFSAGDLLMTTVLRMLRHTDLVAQYPSVDAYRQRCEARPAFQKALAAQMAAFAKHAPPSS